MIDPNLLESLRVAAETAKATAEACLMALQQLQQAQAERQWSNLDDAAAALGPGISPEMLKERCNDGRFTHGVHFINTSDGRRYNADANGSYNIAARYWHRTLKLSSRNGSEVWLSKSSLQAPRIPVTLSVLWSLADSNIVELDTSTSR